MEQRMVLDLYRFTQKLEENLEVILQQQYIKFKKKKRNVFQHL